MALIFGSGEPVSRLRRALDVKGKVNLGVDEIIVPTMQLFDATEPPFRKTGVRWWAKLQVASVVGELGRVRIFHELPVDQLIDKIVATSPGGNTMDIIVGAGPAGIAGGLAVRTTEIVQVDSGGVVSRPLPILTFIDSVTPTSLSQEFFQVNFPNTPETRYLENLDIVLPARANPGPITNAPCITIECTRAQFAFTVSISGLFWDSLPLDART